MRSRCPFPTGSTSSARSRNHRQAEIAGIALSTTSLAVVYAVLVETGLNQTVIGKRLMSATFVTDLVTATALSILFVTPTLWIVPFAAVSVLLVAGLPVLTPWFFARYGDRVIEPEIKLVFACLFCLMWLGARANSHAVLPAFVLGLVMSSHYASHRKEQERMRVVAFAFLTPFFFLKGGMNVSLGALWANLGVLALLFEDGAYDLVVLGRRGHFLRDHLLGSTADRVVEHAPCPVMIVR